MTGQDIVTAVRERLDDPTFEVAKIVRWANWIINDVCSRGNFPFLEKTGTFQTFDERAEYNLTDLEADIDKIYSVVDVDNKRKVEYVKPEDLDVKISLTDVNSYGVPTYWSVFGDKLRLYPIPDGAYNMQINYKRVPDEITVTGIANEVVIPNRFAEMIVLGVYQKALEWNDDYDYAANIEKQYQAQVLKLIAGYTDRVSGQPNIIPWSRPE